MQPHPHGFSETLVLPKESSATLTSLTLNDDGDEAGFQRNLDHQMRWGHRASVDKLALFAKPTAAMLAKILIEVRPTAAAPSVPSLKANKRATWEIGTMLDMSRGEAPKIVYAGGHQGSGDFPDHRHERAWELLYLLEGTITERCGKKALQMRPGTFVVHPPGFMHGDSARERYFLYHILITCPEPLDWPLSGNDLDGEPIRAILDMVVREWYSSGIHRETFIRQCASMLDILMQRCAVHSEESHVARNLVAAACGRFRREFPNQISLQEVARDLNISRSTLYAYFNQALGRTPLEVLDSIRLKHALYLLKHSELAIEEVARGSGYCSSSHLGRKLRHAYRMTATQIRESSV